VNARRPVRPPGLDVLLPDGVEQLSTPQGTRRRLPTEPGVVPTLRQLQDPTHRRDPVPGLVRLHEREPFLRVDALSAANQAAAFFRMDLSSRSAAFSRSSARMRASLSSGIPPAAATAASSTQDRMVGAVGSNSFAKDSAVRPLCTKDTRWALYSAVYVLRAMGTSSPVDSRVSTEAGQLHEAARVASLEPWSVAPDPKHEFHQTIRQMVGPQIASWNIAPNQPAMKWFWYDRAYKSADITDAAKALRFVSAFPDGSLPAIHALAKGYQVLPRWFSSVPAHTLVNRDFVHSCTSRGNVLPTEVAQYAPRATVFSRLARADSRVYWTDYSQVALMSPTATRFRKTTRLAEDIMAGDLAKYTFVEPSHAGADQNNQHPPNHIGHGDAFVAQVYSWLRATPASTCSETSFQPRSWAAFRISET